MLMTEHPEPNRGAGGARQGAPPTTPENADHPAQSAAGAANLARMHSEDLDTEELV